MSIEQLLYFDKLRMSMDTQIEKHKKNIFLAEQTIISEQENIRHVQYDADLMVTILDQTDAKWREKISNYYSS